MVRSVLFAVLLFAQSLCMAQAPDISGDPEIKWNGPIKSVVQTTLVTREAKYKMRMVTVKHYNRSGQMTEKTTEVTGPELFSGHKVLYRYDGHGREIERRFYMHPIMDTRKDFALSTVTIYKYHDNGKWFEALHTHYNSTDTSRSVDQYMYDEQGFLVKQTSSGFFTKANGADWEHVYRKIDNNTIELVSKGSKCIYILSDDGLVVERRWHKGLTDEVYQRQTCRHERGRLVEKITYSGDTAETVYSIKYESPDEAGNYTRALGYDKGQPMHVTEYKFEYY